MFLNRLPTHPWSSIDDKQFLVQMGAYRRDRSKGIEGLTLAGVLMFGKNETLTELLPQYMIDYRETDGASFSKRWSNRIFSDGTWEANLFQSYRKILPRLQSFLPVPFKLKGNERVDETPAHVALREAYVNMCIHAQYESDTNLVIVKHPNEVIFSNPGTLMVSLEQYYAGGKSICRNPSLQKMFLMIGAAEKAGSGADKIMEGWKDAQFRIPSIYETSQPNKVELIMPLESKLSADVLKEMKDIYGASMVAMLNRNESIAIALAVSMGSITNEMLSHSVDMHSADITKLLHGLCNRNLLKSFGFGRGMKYYVNEEYQDNQEPDDKVDERVDNKVDVNVNERVYVKVDDKVEGLKAQEINSLRDERVDEKNERVIEKDERVDEKDEGVRRGKDVIIKELTSFCKTWRKSSEMARHVGKSISYIQSHILPVMVTDGILDREYPDSPRSPRQRYRLKQK